MTDKELMQMALDALIDAADSQNWEMQQNIDQHGEWYRRSLYLKQATTNSQEAIKALRARLAQPEPEPLWIRNEEGKLELHATPQREWQGLTDEDVWELAQKTPDFSETVAAVEAKLKEKNSG
jgi:FtsZ-binding cell division protein ZapB